MKSKEFSDALGNIDERYISEAATYKSTKKSKNWIKWVSLAACVCVVASSTLVAYKKGWFTPTDVNEQEEINANLGNEDHTANIGNPNNELPSQVEFQNLMEGVTPNYVAQRENMSRENAVATDFALRLFKQANQNGKNTLISPVSVLYALAMTANGAEGETRAQMERVLGMSVEELNIYLYSYMQSLPQGKKSKISIANSIWINDIERFNANQEFLQKNADYYGADIYKTRFSDKALKNINNWVNNKTDGMIPSILNEIPDEAVMYLINALVFDAEWANKYTKSDILKGYFTKEDGTRQTVEFMHSDEQYYIEDENAKGFIKEYAYGQYAFVALLPNEDITVFDYLNTLDGSSLSQMLQNQKLKTIKASMPKFEVEYESEMSSILKAMGMTDAFNNLLADFDGIGKSDAGNIHISEVTHKTFIKVDEIGTKAGAATSVGLEDEGMMPPEEIIKINLNRPFVYMIIDCENNIPLFIGTMMDVEG